MQNFEEPFHYIPCRTEIGKMARILQAAAGIR